MSHRVDPFIGCEPTDLPVPSGLAATWWSPKPQIGNTHPGATYPLGMVSACAYSGAYPTGYGRYHLSTEGVPVRLHDRQMASGFTHFQQSGTGAIRKYYNYFRVTPMVESLDELGSQWELLDEQAQPGYYSAMLGNGVRAELTVGRKSAVHRYTFPRYDNARVVVDLSHGGLSIPYGATVPLRSELTVLNQWTAAGTVVVEGAPLSVYLECSEPDWRAMLWYDRRLMPGGTRMDFDAIRPTTLRPFGVMWVGPAEAGRQVELRIGFSLRGVDQARENLYADVPHPAGAFEQCRRRTTKAWADVLGKVRADIPDSGREVTFGTALYHSLIKPCMAESESPWWPDERPFAFDICTMWDIYRTQLPLLTALLPDQAVQLARALVTICQEEGNFPIGYRMARGADRFSRQASALAHTFLADLQNAGLPGIDWELALTLMAADLRRDYGEEYLRNGLAEPITHTLDLAYAYWCTAQIAEQVGDRRLAAELAPYADGWRAAFEDDGRLLHHSTFYEGTRWNYSFRLLHDMGERVAAAGGDEAFVQLLDQFFGFDAAPVMQPGVVPSREEMVAGYELGRFQGMNNEPDMDAPWAYHYAGRPDRTADVVHAALSHRFGPSRGGLPGNDDSGGLSSWYVWASLGLFPVAGQDRFLLNTPAFEESEVDVGGEQLTISTRRFRLPHPEAPAQYVESVSFNDEPLEESWLTGRQLRAGGRLVITLSDEPTAWGSTVRPSTAARPLHTAP